MNTRSVIPILLSAALAGMARAQGSVNTQCSNPAIVGPGQIGGDACQKALDLFSYLTPQFGTTLAGGNPVLGQGGAQGGLGKITVELRVNGIMGAIPKVDQYDLSAGPAVRTAYQTEDKPFGFPSADGALGLFDGIPVGLTKVLAVDALGSLTFVPEIDQEGVSIKAPNGSVKVGYGARLGIIKESTLLPSVAVTWLRRDLPSLDVTAAATNSDTITVSGLTARSTAWRLVAGKSARMLAVAVGYGKDTYESAASLSYALNRSGLRFTPTMPITTAQSPKATSYFADVMLNLFLVKIVGEIGRVSTDDIPTYNSFSKKSSDPKLYGAIGLRFGH
ncbi:MAG: hypothetical protein ACR2OG_18190 [Gemmatimonadaceae bacterium]